MKTAAKIKKSVKKLVDLLRIVPHRPTDGQLLRHCYSTRLGHRREDLEPAFCEVGEGFA